MASHRPQHGRRTKAIEPEDSPEVVHRVAMHVGAMIECENWLKRGFELKRQGKLKASEAATAKARKFMDIMLDIARGTDMRLIDAAASKLASPPGRRQTAHRRKS